VSFSGSFLHVFDGWTVNKDYIRRMNAFEHWCYRRLLERIWMDKISNEEMLKTNKGRWNVSIQKYSKTDNDFNRSCLKRVKWWWCTSDVRRQTGSNYSTKKTTTNDDIKPLTKLDTCEDIKVLAKDRCQWTACSVLCQPSEQEDDNWWWWWWCCSMVAFFFSGLCCPLWCLFGNAVVISQWPVALICITKQTMLPSSLASACLKKVK